MHVIDGYLFFGAAIVSASICSIALARTVDIIDRLNTDAYVDRIRTALDAGIDPRNDPGFERIVGKLRRHDVGRDIVAWSEAIAGLEAAALKLDISAWRGLAREEMRDRWYRGKRYPEWQ